jgi:hypothetical protein
VNVSVAHLRHHDRLQLADRLPGRERVELQRDVAEEELCERLVVGGQIDQLVDRQQITDRLLLDDEGVTGLTFHQEAGVEAVVGAVRRDHLARIHLLDRALDDDKEGLGHLAGANYRLALAEEGDIQARLEALELAAAQAIERRVREVEGLGHGLPYPNELHPGRCGPGVSHHGP